MKTLASAIGRLLPRRIERRLPEGVQRYLAYLSSDPYSAVEEKNQIIFIHVPKTAGNAIIQAMFQEPATGHNEIMHYRAFDRRRFDRYFKFGFVRNPWDRLVSAFFYLKQGGRSTRDRQFAERFLADVATFEDFVKQLRQPDYRRKVMAKGIHFRPQHRFLCDSGGKVLVDFLGRYESLQQDAELLGQRLDRPCVLETHNKSSHRDFRDYYDATAAATVGEMYRQDVEIFDYECPVSR